MTNFLTQNAKLKKTSKVTGKKTFDFAITAKLTCPKAKDCLAYCYASRGAYVTYPVVKNKLAQNFEATKQKSFVSLMYNEIVKKKIQAVRIHSSGDFYNQRYLNKWKKLAGMMPDITFYAYTKSLHLFKEHGENKKLPKNLVIIYSYGGKLDHLINPKKDRHAIVYTGVLPKGYSYANDNDHIALAKNKKIALLKH